MHGFSDSSEIAYGAVICIKSTGEATVKLVTSKSRVAQLMHVTIPDLELCEAVLLAKLIKYVTDLKQDIKEINFWIDSTIVLAWLRRESRDFKTFVSE